MSRRPPQPRPAPALDAKSAGELDYWRGRQTIEGTLGRAHFEAVFALHFGVGREAAAGAAMLDVGCGPRGSLEWAAGSRLRVGLDPLALDYRPLGTAAHAMRYVAGSAEHLPFLDGAFDVVSSFNSLDHVDDLGRACAELARVLALGGALLLLADVHRAPTELEPSPLDWGLERRFVPPLAVRRRRALRRSAAGIYASVTGGEPVQASDEAATAGVISLRLERPGGAQGPSGQPRDVSVTVVIPTHDRQRWLPAAVRSACEQDAAGLEVVIVDDGSRDDTPAVCRALAAADRRVRVVRQDNHGLSHARNAGLAAARGRWVAFLDDDDLLAPQALSSLLAFAAATGAPVVAGRAATFVAEAPLAAAEILGDPARFAVADWPPGAPPSALLTPAGLVLRPQVAPACGLFSTELVRAVAGFDAALRAAEDYDLWLRLGALQAIPVLDRTVALVRRHASQMSGQLGRQAAATRIVLERFLAEHPEITVAAGRDAVAVRLARLCREECYAALLDRRGGDARRAAAAAIRHRPTELKAWAYLAVSPVPGLYNHLRRWARSAPRRRGDRRSDAAPDPYLLGDHREGRDDEL